MEPEGSLPHIQPPWGRSTHSMPPHPNSWRLILIISSHLRGLLNGLYPSGLPQKACTHLCCLPKFHKHRSFHFFYCISRIIFGDDYRSLNSSLCSFLYSLVTSYLLGPNIYLSTLFSKNLSLCSSLKETDQVSLTEKQQTRLQFCYHNLSIFGLIFITYSSSICCNILSVCIFIFEGPKWHAGLQWSSFQFLPRKYHTPSVE